MTNSSSFNHSLSSSILDVIDVHFDYSDKPLLQGVRFSLKRGQLIHLQGQNGAGKTTLLKLLAGLLIPTQGDIHYDGVPINQAKQTYRKAICYLGHKVGVSHALTPREHWHFDLAYLNSSGSFEESVARLLLKGIEDTALAVLSAGQRRRVGMLRLLASMGLIWLLDEPWVALDHDSMLILKELILQHLSLGGAVVLTSHQPLPFMTDVYQVYVL